MISTLLFKPVKIGKLEIKNRIVMSPMVTGLARGDGRVTDAHIAWYERRAKGGAGLIIVEFTAVIQSGSTGPVLLGMWDDSLIPGFRELTDRVHACGARIFVQLSHAGRQTEKAFTGGKLPAAPSAISCPVKEMTTKEIPGELSTGEIEEIIEQFGGAARRSRKAGFDGIEIHGGHGYLISEFMSPYANKRHDIYGGDLTGRMRFPLQVIAKVRKDAGRDFPVSFRYSGDEYVPDGRCIDESVRIAPMLEAAGVNCLHITAGVYESFWSQIPPHGTREGFNSENSAAIKNTVNIPVITVGRIKNPLVAEEILQQKKADLIAMGRQLICDPDWPHKVATGAFEEIRPCIGCTQCINRGIVLGKSISCIYNTSAGQEMMPDIQQTQTPKKVLIVGGGPGGLEAARVAALREHNVILYEKANTLGGRFNLACVPPFKQEFAAAVKWLVGQINKLGVQVVLNKEVTADMVAQIIPDAVIIATGAVTGLPAIPGIDNKKVVPGEDILAGRICSGNRIIIIGGGAIGTEVADFIGQRRKDVTIVEMLPAIGPATGIPLLVAQMLIPRLKSYGVKMLTGASVKKITDDVVTLSINGAEEKIEGIDQVIIATGAKSVNKLASEIEGKVPALFVIGDAREPGTLFEATHEGAEAALKI